MLMLHSVSGYFAVNGYLLQIGGCKVLVCQLWKAMSRCAAFIFASRLLCNVVPVCSCHTLKALTLSPSTCVNDSNKMW